MLPRLPTSRTNRRRRCRDTTTTIMMSSSSKKNFIAGGMVLLHRVAMMMLLVHVVFFSYATTTTTADASADTAVHNSHEINNESIILITGGAGYLGSELALALSSTYQPKTIICIDNMMSPMSNNNNNEINNDNDNLALLEYKRQRIFRMLQQSSSSNILFYRVDFRPSVPEYYDGSEVPILEYIFQEHSPITHIVHLATSASASNANNNNENEDVVFPRVKGPEQEKSGMMESILEQLVLLQDSNNNDGTTAPLLPSFVYGSSGDVYNDSGKNPSNFREDMPLTTPSSSVGTAKLIDELLVQAYHKVHPSTIMGVIGLRFFDVYGPWNNPGSEIFELAESIIANYDPNTNTLVEDNNNDNEDASQQSNNNKNIIRDYVYIDDAIDAIMSAMQLQMNEPQQPVVINVGSGIGTTIQQISKRMKQIVVDGAAEVVEEDSSQSGTNTRSISVANLDRAKSVLGYEPRVSLTRGLEQTLAWHYDRAYPYGSGAVELMEEGEEDNSNKKKSSSIAYKGMMDCPSPYDTDCFLGTPVFPCASECGHVQMCFPTMYDDILELTRALTSVCDTVLYTVAIQPKQLTTIISSHVRVSASSRAYLDNIRCNIAFVDVNSPLYTTTTSTGGSTTVAPDGTIQHGFWTLVPVAVPHNVDDDDDMDTTDTDSSSWLSMLSLLPKLSPGLFFAKTVETAIYTDPDVIIDDFYQLLEESRMQPSHPTVSGETLLLIGKKSTSAAGSDNDGCGHTTNNGGSWQQENAYRTIRMANIDEMSSSEKIHVDSGLLVHRKLNNNNNDDDDDDGRLFRCDVFGEVVQWKSHHDEAALEFILTLHDMWSRVMVQQTGIDPWWMGEDVISTTSRRRLQQQQQQEEENHRRLEEESKDSDDAEVQDEGSKMTTDGIEQEHNGFGVVVDAIEAVFGYGNSDNKQQPQQRRFADGPEGGGEEEEEDDFVVDDDDGNKAAAVNQEPPYYRNGMGSSNSNQDNNNDPSAYDAWMGILSSTDVRYFGRIVNLEAVGVYRVTDEE